MLGIVASVSFGPDIRLSESTSLLYYQEIDIAVTERWIGAVWGIYDISVNGAIGVAFIDIYSNTKTTWIWVSTDENCYLGDPVIIYSNIFDKFYAFFVQYCRTTNFLPETSSSEIIFALNEYGPPSDPSSWSFYIIHWEGYSTFKDRPVAKFISSYNRILVLYLRNYRPTILYSNDGGYTWWMDTLSFYMYSPSTEGRLEYNRTLNETYLAFNYFTSSYEVSYKLGVSTSGGNYWDWIVPITSKPYDQDGCLYFSSPAVISSLDLTVCCSGKVSIIHVKKYSGWCNVFITSADNWSSVWIDHHIAPTFRDQILGGIASIYPNHIWVGWQERVADNLWKTMVRSSPDWGYSWNSLIQVSDVYYPIGSYPPSYDYLDLEIFNGELYIAWGSDGRSSRYDTYIDFTRVSIPSTENSKKSETSEDFKIYSVSGRLVGEGASAINTLPEGVYFVRFKGKTKRFIKLDRP